MMIRNLTLAALLAGAASTALAIDYRASNRMKIDVLSDGTLQVSGTAILGPRSYWCAAGEYGARRLGLKQTDKVYVAQPLTKGGGPMTFTTKRPDSGEAAWTIGYQSVRTAGAAVSVGLAEDYCRDHRLVFD
ncbi:MAG: hypothetical protein AAF754_07360 [Pseudomonadota bacterium]